MEIAKVYQKAKEKAKMRKLKKGGEAKKEEKRLEEEKAYTIAPHNRTV